MKTFNNTNDSFINFDVMMHFAGTWSLGGILVYAYCIHQQLLILLFALCLLLFPTGYKYLYYRWLMFKHNKSAEFIVDTENGHFVYKRLDEVITFKFSDVDKWFCKEYGPFLFLCTYVEIIEIRLKNGKKVTISSGVNTKSLIYHLTSNYKQWGLPPQQEGYRYDLLSYIKQIM